MTELVPYRSPSAGELEQFWTLADRFARTEFTPAALRGKPEAVMACMLAGYELGIGPMQALQKIHIIQGRPTLSAELMASLVRRAGHRLRTIESTATVATVEGARADDPDAPEKVTWTIKDAEQAKLTGKEVWKQYPTAMLWARAISALCRRLFPDVLAGMSSTREELEDDGASTETTWGTPEAGQEQSTGSAVPTATPAEPVAAIADAPRASSPNLPTIGQVDALRSFRQVDDLVRAAPRAFRDRVQAAILDLVGEEPGDFWRSASLKDRRAVLRMAIEQSGADSHGDPAPPVPASAPDPTSQGGVAAGAALGPPADPEAPAKGKRGPASGPAPQSGAGRDAGASDMPPAAPQRTGAPGPDDPSLLAGEA